MNLVNSHTLLPTKCLFHAFCYLQRTNTQRKKLESSKSVDLLAMTPTNNGCLPSFHIRADYNTDPSIMTHSKAVSNPVQVYLQVRLHLLKLFMLAS
jgi:hypothetical protein